MAETERKTIRESTLEGLDAAARKGKRGGRPPVITEDMLHTVLRRRALGETVEQTQPDLIIPSGKRKGQSPSVASIFRALAEHAKREAYPEAIEQAHADFAALQAGGALPEPRTDAGTPATRRRGRPPVAGLTCQARSSYGPFWAHLGDTPRGKPSGNAPGQRRELERGFAAPGRTG
ncbi:hypothetical protein [Streptomyces sp. HUCO-GS316]|uniref:hypothetical protein n=1 Tax=Streptomyces sp. HUCO-GS316 TaxID=2692198 RepID=UPI00235171E9|nr:hypothetical protein [Streptomyces sp. HUCO-GS316]